MINTSTEWQALVAHAEDVKKTHLRQLLNDTNRCDTLLAEHNGILVDYSRQNMLKDTMPLLLALAKRNGLSEKIKAMAGGKEINNTEHRPVLHMALRASANDTFQVNGQSVMPEVLAVQEKIKQFAEKVRSGELKGVSGKALKNIIAIGIGGSYLGGEFVAEALKNEAECASASQGRTLRFLANVDPIDFHRATDGLAAEETLVIIISKTFTTAETMLNARAAKTWLVDALGEQCVEKHMVAVSTNLTAVKAFGINPDNAFGFWDWVGGRYSVCSAVGLLPLAIHFGWRNVAQFLAGARDMDQHFLHTPLEQNLPVLLGLIGIWNVSFLQRPVRALLPYCQALHRFAAHIQQVDMESNGKRVDVDGKNLNFDAGEINFGEPGTNGQHSFYQLIHQGRVVPCDFIGFKHSQTPLKLKDNSIDNHDELMANFFAQPDALALGKTEDELKREGINENLIPHRVFPGNRPSTVLLLDKLAPFSCGQLLALFEHRTAVQGFIWNINSFDQWGVELGKVLAQKVKKVLESSDAGEAKDLPYSTQKLISRYRA